MIEVRGFEGFGLFCGSLAVGIVFLTLLIETRDKRACEVDVVYRFVSRGARNAPKRG